MNELFSIARKMVKKMLRRSETIRFRSLNRIARHSFPFFYKSFVYRMISILV